MTTPQGGSMADLMNTGSEMADAWIDHAKHTHATTPELVALMLLHLEHHPNKLGVMTVLAATSIQRLAVSEFDLDGFDGKNPKDPEE